MGSLWRAIGVPWFLKSCQASSQNVILACLRNQSQGKACTAASQAFTTTRLSRWRSVISKMDSQVWRISKNLLHPLIMLHQMAILANRKASSPLLNQSPPATWSIGRTLRIRLFKRLSHIRRLEKETYLPSASRSVRSDHLMVGLRLRRSFLLSLSSRRFMILLHNAMVKKVALRRPWKKWKVTCQKVHEHASTCSPRHSPTQRMAQ